MTHGELITAIIMEASNRNIARLFKNASGVAKFASMVKGKKNVRTVRYGVGNTKDASGHDIIGWRIPDGKFISIDAKVGADFMSDEQLTWMRWVISGGGLSGEARSVEQAMQIILGGSR